MLSSSLPVIRAARGAVLTRARGISLGAEQRDLAREFLSWLRESSTNL